jgi:hypothetical protein
MTNMPLKFFKKFFILFIVAIIIIASFILFFSSKKTTVKFLKSDSKLEIKEQNFLGKLLEKDNNNQGKLLVISAPEDANIIVKKISLASPLAFEENFNLLVLSSRGVNLESGKYWLGVSKLGYEFFSAPFEVFPQKENKFNIILKPVEEDQTDGDNVSVGDKIISDEKEKIMQYYKTYPLANYLPYQAGNFKIYAPSDDGVYIVELFISVDLLREPDLYQKQKEQYKKEAIDWILQKGFNPNGLKINFFPQ